MKIGLYMSRIPLVREVEKSKVVKNEDRKNDFDKRLQVAKEKLSKDDIEK